MTLHPKAVVVGGEWYTGLDLEFENGRLCAIREQSTQPDDTVVSPAFVNAHSHLEYRLFQDRLPDLPYWQWIRKLTDMKRTTSIEEFARSAQLAAVENRGAGISHVLEHSDAPVAADAMRLAGLKGRIFQEVITFFEQLAPEPKLASIRERAAAQRLQGMEDVVVNPHSGYLVDPDSLRKLAQEVWSGQGIRFSIHFAETEHERNFFEHQSGPIADFFCANGLAPRMPKGPQVDFLADFGVLGPRTQLVHACDVTPTEIEKIAASGACVAHCPRSNFTLGCPAAPIREMLDAGITVALGLDSAASSGRIDMFEEMRAAVQVSAGRGKVLSASEIWQMATSAGANALGIRDWDVNDSTPLIAIDSRGADSLSDLIQSATATDVSTLTLPFILTA